jgi:hypothetical protein
MVFAGNQNRFYTLEKTVGDPVAIQVAACRNVIRFPVRGGVSQIDPAAV